MNGALPQKTEILPAPATKKSAADCTAAPAVAAALLASAMASTVTASARSSRNQCIAQNASRWSDMNT
jgi:hypothetical protein